MTTLDKSGSTFVQFGAAKIESGAEFHHCERKIDHRGGKKIGFRAWNIYISIYWLIVYSSEWASFLV